ncbi:molybdate ABC transporter substrate-binding protein [Desulfatirhabdium butyrativorans]|uniref:molybdate ABC transporter substrate-binding protein n=1 Tax=Desulfatirhabdium butyrativorans TaxID=340467 RepID=UPI00041368C3|nr:molybdate ABC transporter substrate-binding protein [Desulfatirhabdium butyrativorans]
MSKRFLNQPVLWLLVLLATGAIDVYAGEQITVSAAISLKNAFEDIAVLYEKRHPDIKLLFNFGASGDLARQIEGGAPVDVFASAAQKDMDQLDQKGFIERSTRKNFVGNTVVLIKPASSGMDIRGFEDLLKPGVKMVAIGNPKTVPAGRYAQEVLISLKLWDSIPGKIVFTENVRQVLDYIAKNEADAGIVYATDAMVRAREVVVIARAPSGSHTPIVYPLALVAASTHADAARDFIKVILSDEGMKTLQKYGFEPVR